MAVKTYVEPAKDIQIMVLTGDLPIIDPPIILPAPKPGEYQKSNSQSSATTIRWYLRNLRHGRWQFVRNNIRGRIAHKWFLFKMCHGLIQDDRSWLFKR